MILCVTLDADWCSPEARAACLDLLAEARVPFTFFATRDQTPVISPLAENAWHPNFQKSAPVDELEGLALAVPGARGLRPHRLDFAGAGQELLLAHGVRWLSGDMVPDNHLPNRLPGFPDLPNLSINWWDGRWCKKGLEPDWEKMASDQPGAYVVLLHPERVFGREACPRLKGVLADILEAASKSGGKPMTMSQAIEILSDVL